MVKNYTWLERLLEEQWRLRRAAVLGTVLPKLNSVTQQHGSEMRHC